MFSLDKPDPGQELLNALKQHLPALEAVNAKIKDEWGETDGIYRFYHGSYKALYLQTLTSKAAQVLQQVLPDQPLNALFTAILADGTGKKFHTDMNADWLGNIQPILTAFWHAKFFIEQAIHSAKTLDDAPGLLPSGWAAVLYLYDRR